MAKDVEQAFLDDSEQIHFQLIGKGFDWPRDLKVDGNPRPLSEALDIPPQSSN
jgi:hypothetical protein